MKGKSQAELAEAAELARPGYRNIESGLTAPRVDSLMRVAAALGVRPEELLSPVRELRHVRFRADRKMNTRREVLAEVASWLDDYHELEGILGCRAACPFEPVTESVKGYEPGRERAKAAAAEARRRVNLGERDTIRDVCGLLEDNGVKVFTPSRASEGFFGLSVAEADGGPAIVVNTWDRLSVERWIFTAAHELGHLLLHLASYDVSASGEDKAEEKEADTFASYFLMPEALFEREYREARGLPLVRLVMKLKRIFHVSCTSVVYRIASMASDSRVVWTQFQTEYEKHMGRPLDMTKEPLGMGAQEFRSGAPLAKIADEPDRLGSMDFVQDRLYRLVRQAAEGQQISMSRAASILRLDLKSMRGLANSWIAP